MDQTNLFKDSLAAVSFGPETETPMERSEDHSITILFCGKKKLYCLDLSYPDQRILNVTSILYFCSCLLG
jgi:hypothetical protein